MCLLNYLQPCSIDWVNTAFLLGTIWLAFCCLLFQKKGPLAACSKQTCWLSRTMFCNCGPLVKCKAHTMTQILAFWSTPFLMGQHCFGVGCFLGYILLWIAKSMNIDQFISGTFSKILHVRDQPFLKKCFRVIAFQNAPKSMWYRYVLYVYSYIYIYIQWLCSIYTGYILVL